MALGTTASGDRRYMLTPWGAAFDMSAPQGRADAVQRERACMSYCRSMEVKFGPVMAMLVAMKAKADDPEFDAADPDDRVPLTREPLKPCTWWHFPASWPAFMRAELRHRGYSRCRLLKTSHNVAVFHGTDSASQQAVCIKVYDAKPAQMLTSYRALAKTAFRHAVMQVLTDFDTVWGHVVVARWEDGVTLDHIGDARLREVVAEMVVDLALRMNLAGFVHGDLHEKNVVLRTARGSAPTSDKGLSIVLIDLDNLHEEVPRPAWNEPSAAPWGDKEGVDCIQFALAHM